MNPNFNSISTISSTTTTTPLDLTTFNSISTSKRRKNRSRNETKSSTAAVPVAVGSKAKKYSKKKPDPNAPKITPPCTECGKRFWSNKALFGHMRCHPERQWRGINPPLSFRPPISISHPSPNFDSEESSFTDEDQILADSLIMLKNSPNFMDMPISDFGFECLSCKKVFGSHQALGGHRASHKNVKGCFAISKSDEDHQIEENALFRACSINLEDKLQVPMISRAGYERDLDLNMPAPVEDEDYDGSSCSYSSCLTLDLRLGL